MGTNQGSRKPSIWILKARTSELFFWELSDRGHDNEADAHELGSRTREEGAEA
ncbi:hypothetical protein CDL15_Pgr011913 [Punica granatum]|uniref:Uncharacterized protein n=1 Tax=Punica granatum TaxID=22663 RepID=A0A218WC44_PUNGR|nr:hypothetical protein CDL15_Pgr011913 [Punica granatum]